MSSKFKEIQKERRESVVPGMQRAGQGSGSSLLSPRTSLPASGGRWWRPRGPLRPCTSCGCARVTGAHGHSQYFPGLTMQPETLGTSCSSCGRTAGSAGRCPRAALPAATPACACRPHGAARGPGGRDPATPLVLLLPACRAARPLLSDPKAVCQPVSLSAAGPHWGQAA